MDPLVERMLAGEPAALARLLSRVEAGGAAAVALLAAIRPHAGRAATIGITGPPGAGKSTLVDRLTRELRHRERTVGVLAVDPSSPLTSGALLGDRIRMQDHAEDPGVFIRSIGTRGSRGGLTYAARALVDVLDASGKDVVLVETVGVGQTELDVARIARTTVAVLVPEGGDTIQALKSGLMEIADVFVVNKCDRRGAHRFAAELRSGVALAPRRDGWVPPVLLAAAATGVGVPELLDAIVAHGRWRETHPAPHAALHRRAEFLDIVADHARRVAETRLAAPEHAALAERVERGAENPYALALEALAAGLADAEPAR